MSSTPPSDDAYIHALAGSGGGVLSYLLTYPLASISTRLQVDQSKSQTNTVTAVLKIIKDEGWKGLYNGLESALVGVALTQGVYYYWYETVRAFFEGPQKKRLSDLVSLLIAAAAGSITVLLTNPIWVVNVRTTLAAKKKQGLSEELIPTELPKRKGIIETMKDVVKTEGIMGLWNGVIPALILVSNPAIQYMVFEKIKKIIAQDRSLKPIHYFLMGAFSKTIATTVTYPYIVVKSRLQMKQPNSDQLDNKNTQQLQYKNTTDVLLKIWQHEGPLGFFKGIQSKIVQSVLNAAFLFMFKEELVAVVRYTVQLLAALNPMKRSAPAKLI